ncbi:MAG: preprotein translocase subunit SecY [Chitinophagales bacterium]|nr:preprotein translocase subunit SecY [Chitinophagales bacterium]MCZ2392542.1 preprotein translocase subunit SecY [Chitinophagales bacterium]
MKGFIETIKNIWSIVELRNKLLYTLGLLFIYRLGTFVILPGIDPRQLSQLSSAGTNNLFGIFDMFAGGAFGRASVFALGIMPYISASIVMQLLTIAVPYFQKLQKEGESGQKKINQMTRYGTVFVTLLQASAYVKYLQFLTGNSILINPALFWLSTTVILTGGTVFVMWLGEKIQDSGIGNGTSLIIMAGIIATLPASLYQEITLRISGGSGSGLLLLIVEFIALAAIILTTVALIQAVRKVPITRAKKMIGNTPVAGQRDFLPLKVNIAGVMPIIFAQAFLFIPATLIQFFPTLIDESLGQKLSDYTSLPYTILMFILVVLFTYFYTALIVNPTQISDDLKRNNGFIPGVKPGIDTTEYIDSITSKITFPGAVFLGIIAILPTFARLAGVNSQFAVFFGGTSLLIMVAVVLDTIQQVNSHLLNRHYDSLTKSGSRTRVRTASSTSANQ